VTVTNAGNVATGRSQQMDVAIYARSGGTDTLVYRQEGVRVQNLQPGRTTTHNARLQLPAGMATGNYRLVAQVDASDDVVESDESNNEAVTAQAIAVQRGYVDLSGVFDYSRMPTVVVNGASVRGYVGVEIRNDGNIAVGSRETVTVRLVAVRTSDGAEVALGQRTTSGGSLRAGRYQRMGVSVNLPDGLAKGDYQLEGRMTLSSGIVDDDPGNNTILADRSGAALTMVSAEPFVDLTASIARGFRMPTSVVAGRSTWTLLPVTVTNAGNVATARGQRMDIAVYARSGGTDTLVYTQQDVWAQNIQPGRTMNYYSRFQWPAGLADGSYQLVAAVDASDDVAESNETNNQAVTTQRTTVTSNAAGGVLSMATSRAERTVTPVASADVEARFQEAVSVVSAFETMADSQPAHGDEPATESVSVLLGRAPGQTVAESAPLAATLPVLVAAEALDGQRGVSEALSDRLTDTPFADVDALICCEPLSAIIS
jgi:hypothetical protein